MSLLQQVFNWKNKCKELEKEIVDLKVGINHLCGLETTCEDLVEVNAELLAACKAARAAYAGAGKLSEAISLVHAAIKKADEL